MECPNCKSKDVVVATAGNGFGTWKCNMCNSFGSYPSQWKDGDENALKEAVYRYGYEKT